MAYYREFYQKLRNSEWKLGFISSRVLATGASGLNERRRASFVGVGVSHPTACCGGRAATVRPASAAARSAHPRALDDPGRAEPGHQIDDHHLPALSATSTSKLRSRWRANERSTAPSASSRS